MLFNFSQFSQKMPHSLAPGAQKDLTETEALDLAEQHVVYDQSDDGDLMQMLFGMADDVPTMATIHLHKWHNLEGDADDLLDPRMGGSRRGSVGTATALQPQHSQPHPQQPPMPGQQQQMQGPSSHMPYGNGPSTMDIHAYAGTAPNSNSLPNHQGQWQQQQPAQQPMQQPSQPHANGTDPDGAHGQRVKQEGSTGSAGKHSLSDMFNCGDDRDHILDSEAYQLLQSVE